MPPTQTNFIFIDGPKNAVWLFQELQKVGVIVRPVGSRAIRVSTGLREDNEKFLAAFPSTVDSSRGDAVVVAGTARARLPAFPRPRERP